MIIKGIRIEIDIEDKRLFFHGFPLNFPRLRLRFLLKKGQTSFFLNFFLSKVEDRIPAVNLPPLPWRHSTHTQRTVLYRAYPNTPVKKKNEE